MKKLLVALIFLSACAAQTAPQAPASPDVARFQQRAQGITIVRDDWALLYGLRRS